MRGEAVACHGDEEEREGRNGEEPCEAGVGRRKGFDGHEDGGGGEDDIGLVLGGRTEEEHPDGDKKEEGGEDIACRDGLAG